MNITYNVSLINTNNRTHLYVNHITIHSQLHNVQHHVQKHYDHRLNFCNLFTYVAIKQRV